MAEETNKLSLERIRGQQLLARQRLVKLDLRHQELDTVIERARLISSDPDGEARHAPMHRSLQPTAT